MVGILVGVALSLGARGMLQRRALDIAASSRA
jgi:hypothetical protein